MVRKPNSESDARNISIMNAFSLAYPTFLDQDRSNHTIHRHVNNGGGNRGVNGIRLPFSSVVQRSLCDLLSISPDTRTGLPFRNTNAMPGVLSQRTGSPMSA